MYDCFIVRFLIHDLLEYIVDTHRPTVKLDQVSHHDIMLLLLQVITARCQLTCISNCTYRPTCRSCSTSKPYTVPVHLTETRHVCISLFAHSLSVLCLNKHTEALKVQNRKYDRYDIRPTSLQSANGRITKQLDILTQQLCSDVMFVTLQRKVKV